MSVFLIYGLTGQLAALYGLVVVCMSLLCRRRKWSGSLAVFLAGVLLAYIGIRLAIGIPLTDGIYSERYQESQLQPDSYVYFIWIRFVCLASDSVCNGLYDEGSSQRKAFGESICCGKLVGRPVLLFPHFVCPDRMKSGTTG